MRTKMKTKTYLLFLSMLCVCVCAPLTVKGQVKIGSSDTPAQGAVLDLKASDSGSYTGGFLLPNVFIKDVEFIPASFTDANKMTGYNATTGVNTNADLAGMIVYNTNDDVADGVGVYVWDGESWAVISGGAPPVPQWADSTTPANGSIIPEEGGDIMVSLTDENCRKSGVYTCVYEIQGGATAIVTTVSESDGQFKVEVPANPETSQRAVTITISSPCNTQKIYNYTQTGQAPCPTLTQPGSITFGTRPTTTGGTFLAGVTEVTDADSYDWTVPSGMSITTGAGTRTIMIAVNTAGSYNTNAISVVAKNGCGNTSPSRAGTSSAFTVSVPCPTLTQPGTITFSTRPTNTGGTFTASVAAVTDADSYTWTVQIGRASCRKRV